MRHLLSKRNLGVLTRIARSRALLAFDFDGTLAPIVAARDGAAMRPRTRVLLARVCTMYPCAVISGRSRADVSARLLGTGPKYIVGNHGVEPDIDSGPSAAAVAQMRADLEKALHGCDGIDVEDKGYSLAVHYRRSPRKRDVRMAVRQAAARLPAGIRLVPGKLVMNVVPAGAPNKGDALMALRAAEGAETALYVGDDFTDEDVFALDQPGRLLSVRVGASKTSAAAFFVRDQREVDGLLEVLVSECCTRPHGPPDRRL